MTAYVIALDAAHATAVAELLTAFVGPSYSFFNGLPAQLGPGRPGRPSAVLDFAGPSLTFTLSSPTRGTQAQAWTALRQLQAVMKTAAGAFLARAQAGRATASRIRGGAGRRRQLRLCRNLEQLAPAAG